MKLVTSNDMREYLAEKLGLADRSITFHIAEPGPEFGTGLIDSWESIDMSEAFSMICAKQEDNYNVTVDSVITYRIGTGKNEDGTWSDIKTIERACREAPEAFSEFIAKYAKPVYRLVSDHM